MPRLNIEIKAKVSNHKKIREILKQNNANYAGRDDQVDTYFKVKFGRLKLRQGDIENNLVYYNRERRRGPKRSLVTTLKVEQNTPLKEILEKSLGVLAEVNKKREIYFISNVKFHLDDVGGLGKFVEIEAREEEAVLDKDILLEQCKHYMELLKINKKDLIDNSYSDLLLEQRK